MQPRRSGKDIFDINVSISQLNKEMGTVDEQSYMLYTNKETSSNLQDGPQSTELQQPPQVLQEIDNEQKAEKEALKSAHSSNAPPQEPVSESKTSPTLRETQSEKNKASTLKSNMAKLKQQLNKIIEYVEQLYDKAIEYQKKMRSIYIQQQAAYDGLVNG